MLTARRVREWQRRLSSYCPWPSLVTSHCEMLLSCNYESADSVSPTLARLTCRIRRLPTLGSTEHIEGGNDDSPLGRRESIDSLLEALPALTVQNQQQC